MSFQTKSNKALFPIGIGTWDVGSYLDRSKGEEKYRGVQAVHGQETTEIEAIRYSIELGQNHIDCAELYGAFYTDEIIGRAIAGAPRENLFIADKLWRTSVGKGLVRPTVEKMLEKLGTDYLDLLYIHAPWEDYPWREAVPQIDALIDEGLVRYFGVSNFPLKEMEEAMALARHPLAANQMHYSVLHQQEVGEEFRAFCKAHRIEIFAYQPVKRREALESEVVRAAAQKHDVAPAQVALAWLLQHGVWPIIKATTKAHIDQNVKAVKLRLTNEEMERLDQMR